MPEIRSASENTASGLVLFVDVFIDLGDGLVWGNCWSVKLVKKSATPK